MKIKSLFSVLLAGLIGLCWLMTVNAEYSQELQDAYEWAHSVSVTTQPTIDSANMMWNITRAEMAKMISNYAKNILNRTGDETAKCDFTDTSSVKWDLSTAIIDACQLGIMWQWITDFRPNDTITRAEFWTVLSRTLWWDKNEWWSTYYENHLKALNSKWIMNNISTPMNKEVRWYVMLMLMRSSWSSEQKFVINEIPEAYKTPATKQWKVVKFTYKTANEDKYANIYLPYWYSESKKYDILYLMHWGGGSVETLFWVAWEESEMRNVFDHLIENWEMKPIIIVTPTFYSQKNSDNDVAWSWDAVKAFPDELVNYLMPAVETEYSTYAETADDEGFIASRNHRSFWGFSMWSVTTWNVFESLLKYYHTFINVSWDSWTIEMQWWRSKPEETTKKLSESIEKQWYTSGDFFIFEVTGTEDIAEPMMSAQTKSMKKDSSFKFTDYEQSEWNAIYVVKEWWVHNMVYVDMYLYNILPYLYKNDNTSTYETRELHVKHSNWDDIYGVVYIPNDGKTTHPLIIMSHGLGGTADNMQKYCETMAEEGYVTYCYDFRWGGEKSRSSLKTTEMSPLTEVEDLKAVLAAAKTWNFVDTSKIYMMWCSQWGLVTALTAWDVAEDIAGIITFYPAFTAKDMVHENYNSLDEVPDSQWFNWLTLGKKYWEDMWDYDAYAQAGKYTGKVLLVQWDADVIVDISYAEQYKDALSDVEYHVISWAGHSFTDTDEHYAEAIGYLKDFLNK